MDAKQLIARLEDQRKHWVDLPDGKRLQYLRPPEVELAVFLGGVKLEHVERYACGWSGFTEADILGADVGSSDEQPFDRDLWAALVKDRSHYIPPVIEAMAATASAYLAHKAAVGKNSEPFSTLSPASSTRAMPMPAPSQPSST